MFAHPSGQWAKKIRGRLHYFGVWADPEAALERLNREWPCLKEGKTPPPIDVSEGVSLEKVCNEFMAAKEAKLNEGDISPRSYRDYYETCRRLLDYFGKDRRVDDLRPEDFGDFRKALAETMGPTSLKNARNRVRIIFKFPHDNRLIPNPVNYGQYFDRPSARVLRRSRNEAGPRLFSAKEIRRILAEADPTMRAMILLGINCGFGNNDVARLPQSRVDLDKGWVDFPRPRTKIPRRVLLWPETIEALRVAIARRPRPVDGSGRGLCFLTKQGRPWVRVNQRTVIEDGKEKLKIVPIDALVPRFGRLLRKLGINGRKGLGFYTLRHAFETIGGESKDQVAVDAIMGHADSSMAAIYREEVSDARLKAVVEVVRKWLFDSAPSSPEKKAGERDE